MIAASTIGVKTRFIVNPRSGASLGKLPSVREFATRHGASMVFTERSRHASKLAEQALADGCELVVAVGGDGTMNEIASVLAGSASTLGLVPCGSGDGLGRFLGVHGPVGRALEILLSGVPRLIDSGLADGHPFFSMAGLGFEAEIARKFNQLQHRGFLRYVTTSIAAWRQWRPSEYVVTYSGGRDAFRAFTVAIANSNQYGNNARIAPHALIDDGELDLCAVPPLNVFNVLPLATQLFGGSLANGVITRRADEFVIERKSSGPLHTDGETHEAGKVIRVTVRPASLRILVPRTNE
ncbi:MAG: hypothetical protein RIQ93_509 [Verrucomicrobiota bacterium]